LTHAAWARARGRRMKRSMMSQSRKAARKSFAKLRPSWTTAAVTSRVTQRTASRGVKAISVVALKRASVCWRARSTPSTCRS